MWGTCCPQRWPYSLAGVNCGSPRTVQGKEQALASAVTVVLNGRRKWHLGRACSRLVLEALKGNNSSSRPTSSQGHHESQEAPKTGIRGLRLPRHSLGRTSGPRVMAESRQEGKLDVSFGSPTRGPALRRGKGARVPCLRPRGLDAPAAPTGQWLPTLLNRHQPVGVGMGPELRVPATEEEPKSAHCHWVPCRRVSALALSGTGLHSSP